jgi:hypothetical protein
VAVAATVGCPCPGACLGAAWASAQTGSSAGSAQVDDGMIVLGEASSQQLARKVLEFFPNLLSTWQPSLSIWGSCWRPSLPKLLGAICHGSALFFLI